MIYPMKIACTFAIAIICLALPASSRATSGSEIASETLGFGATAFNMIETFRLMVYEGATAKVGEIKEERQRETERLKAQVKDDANVDALITAQARPHVENVEDSSGIVEGLMMQVLSVVTFIFGQVFVFYPLIIVFIFWLIRMTWKRFNRTPPI